MTEGNTITRQRPGGKLPLLRVAYSPLIGSRPKARIERSIKKGSENVATSSGKIRRVLSL